MVSHSSSLHQFLIGKGDGRSLDELIELFKQGPVITYDKHCILMNAAYETGNLDILKAVYEARPFDCCQGHISTIIDHIPLTKEYLPLYTFLANEAKKKGRNGCPLEFFKCIKIYLDKYTETELISELSTIRNYTDSETSIVNAAIETGKGDLLCPELVKYYYKFNIERRATPEILDFLVKDKRFKHIVKINNKLMNSIIAACNVPLLKYCLLDYGDKFKPNKAYVFSCTKGVYKKHWDMLYFLFDELGIKVEISYLNCCLYNRNAEGLKYLYERINVVGISNKDYKSLLAAAKYGGSDMIIALEKLNIYILQD